MALLGVGLWEEVAPRCIFTEKWHLRTMADGKRHFLPGKMSGFLTPWWGAPGAVIVKSPSAANH